MRDYLFTSYRWPRMGKNQRSLYSASARAAGVDLDKYDACMDDRRYAGRIQASDVFVEIQAGGPGEVAEQGPRILTRLRPLMVGEELVVHLPELALLAPALRGKRGVARVLVAGEREIAIAPAHLSGGDELLADHRHLHGRER